MTRSEPPNAIHRYRLKFLPVALEEWNALDGEPQAVFKKLLRKRLDQPHLPGAELHHELRNSSAGTPFKTRLMDRIQALRFFSSEPTRGSSARNTRISSIANGPSLEEGSSPVGAFL